jgi:signal transduction histidine kinase
MKLRASVFFGSFFFWFVFWIMPAAGQELDSALVRYRSFFEERKTGRTETSLAAADSLLEEAKLAKNYPGMARMLTELGLLHLTRTRNYDQSIDYFIRALALEDSLRLKGERVFTLLGVAQVFEEVGDYAEGADLLEQARKATEQVDNLHLLIYVILQQGDNQAAQGKLDDAVASYNQVLGYRDQLHDPSAEAEAQFRLAHVYTQQTKYDEALEEHKKALTIRRTIDDRAGEAVSLNEIGELYRLMANQDKALANHQVALKIRKQLGNKRALAESYNNIGILYYMEKRYERAINELLLALDAARDSQDQNQISRSNEYLSMAYAEAGDYKNAFRYKKEYQEIHDFIEHEKNERQLIATRHRYTLDQKESRIGSLEADRVTREREIEAQKQFRNVLFVFIGLVLIIAALVIYLYLMKRRSNQELQTANDRVSRQNLQLQQLNATKDKFFSILGHDLKGPLNSLTSFSGLLINHTDSLSKDEIKMLALDLDKSLKNLFALLENLLEWSRSQTGNIEFKPERFDLASVLETNKELLKVQAQNKKIGIENACKAEVVVHAHRHSINTVVRNLVSNAIKFTPEGGSIIINAQQAQEEVMVSVADNGVGMTPEMIGKLFRIDTKLTTKGTADEKGTGLGLILCKEFIEKNGGRIGVDSTPGAGTVFYFTLPRK